MRQPRSYTHLFERRLVGAAPGKQWLDDFGEELVDLLRRAADEPPRVHRPIELVARDAERVVGGDAVEQVVVRGAVLQCARRGDTVAADPLVRLLPISASAHGSHEEL